MKVEDLFGEVEVHECGCMSAFLAGTNYVLNKDICNTMNQFLYWTIEKPHREEINFETVLDRVDKEVQANLLFHLDIFTGNDVDKIWSDSR